MAEPHPELPESELCYFTTNPYEIPLVMPAWARTVPALAKQIDDGYDLRRAAGLPIDGSFPDDWPGYQRVVSRNLEGCS